MARKKGRSATSRTIEYFTKLGYRCEIVERFIPGARIRKDFLSCIDLLAMKEGKKTIVGVQCFTTAWTEHEKKICQEFPDGALFWLSLKRTKLIFIGWRKLKVKRGGKAIRWTPRIGVVKIKKGKLILKEVSKDAF